MSVSGSRAGDEINLEEFERRLRAAGAQQARAEDPLAELSRLVEFSHFGISNGGTPARPLAQPNNTSAEAVQPIENVNLRPTIDEEVEELAPGASEADRAARRDYEFDVQSSNGAPAEEAAERRPMRWKLAVSGLAIAGVAMIGAVFALKGAVPGLPKTAPFIAAAQGPVKVAPPSNETVASSNDPGASLLNDSAKPGAVKVVNSEEQPVDLAADASLSNPPSAAANPPSIAANPLPASGSAALAATVNTPLVATPGPPPPALSQEFPDPKPVRTVSLRPDGTPIALANPADQAPSDAKPAVATAPAPAALAPNAVAEKTTSEATGAAQPSTPKLDLPARPSEKSAARVVVAKTDTTAPEPSAQTPNEAAPNNAPAKPEKAARRPKSGQVADAAETTGAIAQPPVDATAATTSGGWSVQLAAPRSEAEASSELAKLNTKYAAELNGSTIGVHKAVVKGETIYRLRVVGLTKADAAKLCARLKGDGGQCFIAR